jgi:hypothetical protein
MPRRGSKSAPSAPLHRIAIEIGYICIYWAWLEGVIDELITILAPLEPGQPADAITGNTDTRQKVQMVRALAFLRKGIHTEWYGSVVETFNAIDSDLRTRRNQLVHSGWYTPEGKLTRQKKSVKISKPQSFRPPVLSTNSKVIIKIEDVRSLRKDILQAFKKVTYQAAFAKCFDEAQSHGISFREFLRLAAPLMRRTRAQQRQRRLQKVQLGYAHKPSSKLSRISKSKPSPDECAKDFGLLPGLGTTSAIATQKSPGRCRGFNCWRY